MRITAPCIITSRLLAGIRIGNATISIEYSPRHGDERRLRYRYHIDIDKGPSHTADNLQSGNGTNNGLQGGLVSLLSFLGAAAESYRYAGAEGENADLFPLPIVQWAAQNSDEISLAKLELSETENAIVE